MGTKTIKPRIYHVENKDGKKTLCGLKLKEAPNRLYYKYRSEVLKKNNTYDCCKDCLAEVKAIKAQKKLSL